MNFGVFRHLWYVVNVLRRLNLHTHDDVSNFTADESRYVATNAIRSQRHSVVVYYVNNVNKSSQRITSTPPTYLLRKTSQNNLNRARAPPKER